MPKVVPIVRVSTIGQADGYSEEDQAARMERFYQQYLAADYTLHPTLFDTGESASKKPMFRRKEGKKLMLTRHGGIMEPGDCVLIDRIDRAFRSLSDGGSSFDYWKKHGIVIKVRDFGDLDTTSLTGEMMIYAMIFAAHMESMIKSQRSRERAAEAKLRGNVAGPAPYGFKHHGKPGHKKLIIDTAEVELMEFICYCRLVLGMKWPQIHYEVERRLAAQKNKPWREGVHPSLQNPEMGETKVRRLYAGYWQFRRKAVKYTSQQPALNEHFRKRYQNKPKPRREMARWAEED